MKTKIIISVVALSLVLITKSAFAEKESTIRTPKTVRSQVKEVRQEAKTTITQIREEKKSTISEIKHQKVNAAHLVVKKGLEKRHAALLKIKDKIQARIDKNPMNKDTTAAKTEFAKFTNAEAKYQTDFNSLQAKIDSLSTSTNQDQAIKDIKSSIQSVRTDLNTIKEILTKTVTALAKAPKLTITPTN